MNMNARIKELEENKRKTYYRPKVSCSNCNMIEEIWVVKGFLISLTPCKDCGNYTLTAIGVSNES